MVRNILLAWGAVVIVTAVLVQHPLAAAAVGVFDAVPAVRSAR
jgi:hypothetical protein